MLRYRASTTTIFMSQDCMFGDLNYDRSFFLNIKSEIPVTGKSCSKITYVIVKVYLSNSFKV